MVAILGKITKKSKKQKKLFKTTHTANRVTNKGKPQPNERPRLRPIDRLQGRRFWLDFTTILMCACSRLLSPDVKLTGERSLEQAHKE